MAGSAFVLAGVSVGACDSSPAAAPQTAATTPAAKVAVSASGPATASVPVAASSAQPQLPGVINDCTAAPPLAQKAVTDPATIVLACADNGIGIEALTWSSWTATGATGAGRVWANDCTPSCAAGKIITYPAAITLSGVTETTKDGLLFSQVTATYQGAHHGAPALNDFPLPKPSE
jgi:hypothetical protein